MVSQDFCGEVPVFAIAEEQRQYKTYVLRDEGHASCLEIVPERGGIVTRWQVRGQEVLYLDGDRFANPELSVRGGIPILFPICGNLPDNTYTLNGQTYTLKQHGFARDLPWQVTDRSTEDGASLTLTLVSSEATRAVYPFDFRLDFTYILQGDTLTIRQRYLNQSGDPMPFSTGLHPYFQVADKSALTFDIPAKSLINQITWYTEPFEGRFDFSMPEIDVAFPELSGQRASMTDPQRQLEITMEADPNYSVFVFWTQQGKDFCCVEPWTAPRYALVTGDRLLHLEPAIPLTTEVRLTARSAQS